MKDDFDKKVLRAYLRGTVEKLEQYFNDLGIESYRSEQLHKIFKEPGFTRLGRRSRYVDAGCDGFCPECEQMLRCESYKEMKDEWEWFYT